MNPPDPFLYAPSPASKIQPLCYIKCLSLILSTLPIQQPISKLPPGLLSLPPADRTLPHCIHLSTQTDPAYSSPGFSQVSLPEPSHHAPSTMPVLFPNSKLECGCTSFNTVSCVHLTLFHLHHIQIRDWCVK